MKAIIGMYKDFHVNIVATYLKQTRAEVLSRIWRVTVHERIYLCVMKQLSALGFLNQI